MHNSNLLWLTDLKKQYPTLFRNVRVLELGAAGTWLEVRALFEDSEYTGIDIKSDPNVNLLVRATETVFEPGSFDVIVCLSMFEHDPTWQESLSWNLQYLRKNGTIIGCHGAEGNLHHGPDPWNPVPAQVFLDYCETLPVQVVLSFFEEDMYGPDCAGAYDWLLWKVE